ncbi:Metallo-beta-lactamase superfamily protein [Bacteroidales bacterium Barb7]|nr:Metallo-beta-lactamase superfamily protein [Bacteroidales bacterium Barb7]
MNKFSIFLLSLALTSNIAAQQVNPATSFTEKINAEQYNTLNFNDSIDYVEANQGLIALYEGNVILNSKGNIAVNLGDYDFIKGKAPASVNPALWRHAELNTIKGLFKITDGVYQVRGLDLTNITFVESDNGYIVIDPVTTPNATQAAYDLVKKHIGNKQVVAIISTHSHLDHFGGIAGVADKEDILSGKIKYIAPKGFIEEAVSENVLLGNVMGRRAIYQFGAGLPKSVSGIVDSGLGKNYSGNPDATALWVPNVSIEKTGQKLNIDGVEFVFQYTPETEAPAEMMFFVPKKKVFFCAELATRTLHNLLPPRGTKVRDAKSWAAYLRESIDLFGADIEYVVPAHSWPFFGKERSLNFLEKQSDLYKYIHDQTIHLANQGLNAEEIAAAIQLPESLSREWFNQDFYGTIIHNVKAVYQYYIGWYDGNPANYNRLPQVEEAKRYIEWFGGEQNSLKKAQESYNKGDYQWVAQALKWVVFANPKNQEAKNLQADAFEQLGYQSTSSIWRNLYLVGAKELREGNVDNPYHVAGSSFLKNLSPEDLFDYLSIAVDGKKAAGREFSILFDFTDQSKQILLYLKNGVLHQTAILSGSKPNLTLKITSDKLKELLSSPQQAQSILFSEDVSFEGSIMELTGLSVIIEPFNLDWNIVTP